MRTSLKMLVMLRNFLQITNTPPTIICTNSKNLMSLCISRKIIVKAPLPVLIRLGLVGNSTSLSSINLFPLFIIFYALSDFMYVSTKILNKGFGSYLLPSYIFFLTGP